MRAFAELLERLVLTPSRNRKIDLLCRYFAATGDPDRGYGMAAITGDLDLPSVKPALIRELAAEAVDPELFRHSYDFVGDLAETVALVWPARGDRPCAIALSQVVERLAAASRSDAPGLVRDLLDALPPGERHALIKLATGAMRIGISARLAKQALARFGDVDIGEIEELWHGLSPPFADLFAWLEGRGDRPVSAAAAPFRPVMLSNPLGDRDREAIAPETHQAEWKWDGIRVQAVAEKGARRLYTRTGDDISRTFPDIVDAMDFDAAIDGELLVRRGAGAAGEIGAFADLQQRLNRKTVGAAHLDGFPAFIRAYDLLFIGGDDRRSLPLTARRRELAALVDTLDPSRFDLSRALEFTDFDDLVAMRADPPHPIIEGLMLKRLDSPYLPGRPRGPWFKWKKDPHRIDAVLMYAQRGHGKRSGYYSDFTFGVWRGAAAQQELVPVGKAYFGFTDEELRRLDRFVRDNTVERFGPVRSVVATAARGLVLEVAFEGLARSNRHKSGVAMRFPRIARIRWDKPAAQADRLDTLEAMLADTTPLA